MIELLQALVEEERFAEASRLATKIMAQNHQNPEEMVVLYRLVLNIRANLGELQGAVSAGAVAVDMAAAYGLWDVYGAACVDLAAAYGRLGHHSEAATSIYRYLEHLNLYHSAKEHEALAWFNLGKHHTMEGRTSQATEAYHNALLAADRLKDGRTAHGIRQALLDAYLKALDLTHVPRLLVKCAHYIRRFPDAPYVDHSRLYHVKLRARYALLTGRLSRAKTLALYGIILAREDARHLYDFHLILSEVFRGNELTDLAIDHAFAGRAYAVILRRADFEAGADRLILELTSQKADAGGLS